MAYTSSCGPRYQRLMAAVAPFVPAGSPLAAHVQGLGSTSAARAKALAKALVGERPGPVFGYHTPDIGRELLSDDDHGSFTDAYFRLRDDQVFNDALDQELQDIGQAAVSTWHEAVPASLVADPEERAVRAARSGGRGGTMAYFGTDTADPLTRQRKVLRDRAVALLLTKSRPLPPGSVQEVVLLMGPPGSGKSTARAALLPAYFASVGIDDAHVQTLNPDLTRAFLPEVNGGAYASVVHGEALAMNTQLETACATTHPTHVVFDRTGARPDQMTAGVRSFVERSREAGMRPRVSILVTDIPAEETLRRVRARQTQIGRGVEERFVLSNYDSTGQLRAVETAALIREMSAELELPIGLDLTAHTGDPVKPGPDPARPGAGATFSSIRYTPRNDLARALVATTG